MNDGDGGCERLKHCTCTAIIAKARRVSTKFRNSFSDGLMGLIACKPALRTAPFHHLRAAQFDRRGDRWH